VDALVEAGETQNTEKAIYAAHTLKGSARSVGAMPLGDLCESLEKLARASDLDGFREQARFAPETFALLGRELAEVLQPKAA
jgi:HPt (histidine-containing phosphotransfer) domain-containing protein